MKKLWMSTALAAVIVTASGCTSYNVNQPSAPMDGVVSTDLKADVRVGEPITGQSSVNILFGFLKFGGDNQFADGVAYGGTDGGSLLSFDPVSSVKSAAAFKAVKSSGADLIVAPRYEVTGNNGNIAGIR
jgi:hypothetical protein